MERKKFKRGESPDNGLTAIYLQSFLLKNVEKRFDISEIYNMFETSLGIESHRGMRNHVVQQVDMGLVSVEKHGHPLYFVSKKTVNFDSLLKFDEKFVDPNRKNNNVITHFKKDILDEYPPKIRRHYFIWKDKLRQASVASRALSLMSEGLNLYASGKLIANSIPVDPDYPRVRIEKGGVTVDGVLMPADKKNIKAL